MTIRSFLAVNCIASLYIANRFRHFQSLGVASHYLSQRDNIIDEAQLQRKHGAIAVQSLRNRSEISSKSGNRYEIAEQSLRNRFEISAQSLRNRCTIASNSQYNSIVDAALLQRKFSAINAQSPRKRSTIVLKSQHNRSTIASKSQRNSIADAAIQCNRFTMAVQ
jgi:hypothetical protein